MGGSSNGGSPHPAMRYVNLNQRFGAYLPVDYRNSASRKRPSLEELAKKYGEKPGATAPTGAAGWQFPQYSQTWAFTPPQPTPLISPPPFVLDPKDTKKK